MLDLSHLAPPGATVSVVLAPLAGTAIVEQHADAVHLAASTMKIAVALAARRLHPDEEIRVDDEHASAVPGTTYRTTRAYDNDDEPWLRLGATAPIGWLVERMLVRSSNLAANLLLARLGTRAVQAEYDEAGAVGCRVTRGIEDVAAARAGVENTVTARGLALLLDRLAGTEVEDVMARCQDDDMAVRGLPAGTRFAHKPGWIDGVCHDAGIVRPAHGTPFAMVLLTTAALPDADLRSLVADLAAACWEHRP